MALTSSLSLVVSTLSLMRRGTPPKNKNARRWPSIFNDDATLTSALLDRLLHHAETVVITGKSYRMKDQTDT